MAVGPAAGSARDEADTQEPEPGDAGAQMPILGRSRGPRALASVGLCAPCG